MSKYLAIIVFCVLIVMQPQMAGAQDRLLKLPEGTHFGYITGFETLSFKTHAKSEDFEKKAIASGMKIGRIQIDWSELEAREGRYDRAAIREALEPLKKNGLRPKVMLSTVDIAELTLPQYLAEDENNLKRGMQLDDPYILSRFQALLDWLVPILNEYDVWLLSLGNEVDARVNDFPDEKSHILNFFSAGIDHIHKMKEAPSVGVTLTSAPTGNDQTIRNFASLLIAKSDVVIMNYYCLNAALTASTQENWKQDIDSWLSLSQGKEIVIQELGCPVGYKNEKIYINASTELQTQFFEYMFARMKEEKQMRAAFVFQLFDWSDELTKLMTDPIKEFENEGEGVWVKRYREWLRTIGLCPLNADQECRPAADLFLKANEP